MATVNGMTAEAMQEIADNTVVEAEVVGNNLVLRTRAGDPIIAGDVRGPQGPPGTDPSIQLVTSTTRPTTGLFDGLAIYETDTDRFFIYNGTAWVYRGGLWLCTNTTRPASPFAGLQIYETNTGFTYIYNGAAWVYRGGLWVCTSVTRPSAPFSGLEIYETDTKRKYIYDGSVWNQTSGPGAWTVPTLLNGWTNVGGRQGARYCKVADTVYIQGQITGGVSGSVAFVLPSGYRPAAQIDLVSTDSLGVMNIAVTAAGNVTPGASGSNARNINAVFHI